MEINRLTFGVRFNRSFRIPDISGYIIDDIIADPKSPFKEKFFSEVYQDPSGRQKMLASKGVEDENPNRYLKINSDDLILSFKFSHDDFEIKFNWLKNDVLVYLQKIFREYKINNIQRIGVIFSHQLKNLEKLDKAVSDFSDQHIKNATDLNLSFSKKIIVPEAQVLVDVNDFQNTIYTFNSNQDGHLVQLDFQHYYNPVIADFRECKAEKVLDSAKLFLENNFYPWIKDYGDKK